jgi:hypothetical protein
LGTAAFEIDLPTPQRDQALFDIIEASPTEYALEIILLRFHPYPGNVSETDTVARVTLPKSGLTPAGIALSGKVIKETIGNDGYRFLWAECKLVERN